MQEIGNIIRELRLKNGYPLRKVGAFLDIDQAILSKMERGQRRISKEQVLKLAEFFNVSKRDLLVAYLSDKVVYELQDEELAKEALKVAEEKIEYVRRQKVSKTEIVKKIRDILRSFGSIQKAWIYGSFARGDYGYSRDIDIAVKTNEGVSYFDLAEIQHKLETKLDRKLDIGFIDSFKDHIFKHVKSDLELIYERK
jgi:predicted nucleotidyltransferase/plasmid maintenance system antidote protein VapI